jgi:hypothetical protein
MNIKGETDDQVAFDLYVAPLADFDVPKIFFTLRDLTEEDGPSVSTVLTVEQMRFFIASFQMLIAEIEQRSKGLVDPEEWEATLKEIEAKVADERKAAGK